MNYSDIKDAERQSVLLTRDFQFQRSCLATEVSDTCLVLNNYYGEVSF